MDPTRKRIYSALNFSTAPIWLAMILLPRTRLTRWLVGRSETAFLGLGAAYAALLGAGVASARKPVDYRDADAVRAALQQPDTFLGAWTHYIAFDLFVGRWIWQDALHRGARARLAMFTTWMFGPSGLSLYLVQRRRATTT